MRMPFHKWGSRSSASMFQGRGVAAFISANEEDLPGNGTRIGSPVYLEYEEIFVVPYKNTRVRSLVWSDFAII